MKSILFLVFVLMLIVPSCQKDKKYHLTEKEKLLTSHGWRMSSIKFNGVEGTLNPWKIDDCWVFRADGTFTYYYGTNRFHQPVQDMTLTWELSDDEKSLIYASATQSIYITESEMVLTYIYEGDTRVYTYVPC